MTGKGETLGTVQRVVEILRHLAEHGETTIKDLSAALGLVPSTCHRMLDLLAREGLVDRNAARRSYVVGPEFFRLASLVHTHLDVRSVARPFLQQVVDACNETCVLSLYLPAEGHMVFAEKCDSSQLLRYQLTLNAPLPVAWGASGRSIMAFLPEEERKRLYKATGTAPATGHKLAPAAELEEELAGIRKHGYAITHGQKIAGAVGISAPVFGAGGTVIGSLGVTVPEQRIAEADEVELADLVRRHANALSRALGAPEPPLSQKAASA